MVLDAVFGVRGSKLFCMKKYSIGGLKGQKLLAQSNALSLNGNRVKTPRRGKSKYNKITINAFALSGRYKQWLQFTQGDALGL